MQETPSPDHTFPCSAISIRPHPPRRSKTHGDKTSEFSIIIIIIHHASSAKSRRRRSFLVLGIDVPSPHPLHAVLQLLLHDGQALIICQALELLALELVHVARLAGSHLRSLRAWQTDILVETCPGGERAGRGGGEGGDVVFEGTAEDVAIFYCVASAGS